MNLNLSRCRLPAIATLAGIAFALTSCTTVTSIPPLYQDPVLQPAAINDLALLKWADVRLDKSKLQDCEKWFFHPPEGFRSHGYNWKIVKAFAPLPPTATELDLAQPPSDWVRALPSEGARWVLLFAVQDTATSSTLVGFDKDGGRLRVAATDATVELAAYLYDKESGKLMWRHKSTRYFRASMSMFAVQAALADALKELGAAFPTHSGQQLRSMKLRDDEP